SCLREIGGHNRKGSRRQCKPVVAVETSAEELEVVGKHEQDTGRDEGQESDAEGRYPRKTQCDRAGEPHDRGGPQDSSRQFGLQRPSAQLIERVRGNANGKKKSEQRGDQPCDVESRRQAGPKQDVGEVPSRIRPVEPAPDVAEPNSRASRVVRTRTGRAMRYGTSGTAQHSRRRSR